MEGTTRMMKPTRGLLCLILAGLMVQALPVHKAFGQDDDLNRLFDDEELDEPVGNFNPPPPPPMPPPGDFNNNQQAGFPEPPPPSDNPSMGGGRGGGSQGGNSKNPPKLVKKAGTSKDLSTANIEDITNENYPDLIESFDYPNAEITDVVKAISQLTGKNFIIDPGVRGKISIIAPSQITVAEAYKAFLSALAINSFTVVPSGKFLKVKSARNAQRDSIETYSGKYYPNSDIMITRIIHLKHTSAEEINKRLRILPSKDGEMTPYEPTNSLIVSDYGSNVERIMKIIDEIDKPGFEEQLAVIPIRYAKSKDLADLINQIINKEPTRGGGMNQGPAFGAGIPRFRSQGGTAGGGTPEELSLVAPDDRTNAIIVVGNQSGVQKVRDLVKKLDYKLDPAEAGGVFVYYVRYAEAEKIATTLSGLAGGASPAPQSAPGGFGSPAGFGRASPLDKQAIFGGDVKITADKNTNSLVITASKQDYQTVISILSKLDIPKDQVFVEAIIMEMNSQKSKVWQPNYYYLDPSSGGIGRTGFVTSKLTNLVSPINDNGVILGFGGGSTIAMNIGGTTVQVPNLLAFMNLIQTTTESNVLSTPRILAIDNEEATIEVGDTIPIGQDSVTTGSTVQNNTKFEKATIKLTITPFIRPDSETVRLKIDQSVKQPSNTTVLAAALAATTTVISDRSIKTNITISNGDTAVLGGLIRDEDSVQETKVPILGDVPVLGWLFKSRNVTKKKINLVVFITPKIIRSIDDSHANLSHITNDRIDWLKNNFDGRDPYGHKIDTLPRALKGDSEAKAVDPISSGKPVNKKKQ
jgi:general secretion pathway protein D